MKKLTKILFCLALITSLTACQNASNATHDSAGQDSKQEKATSESQVSLTVNGNQGSSNIIIEPVGSSSTSTD